MSDFQTIADRVEIEALRGEFTDAAMMRDYDRLASLFTPDGALRMPNIPVELVGQEGIRAWGERVPDLVDFLVQNTHPGTIALDGDTASGRAYMSELGRTRDGRQGLNYAIYHDRYQRTGDGWKFTERVYEVRYEDTTPLAGSPPRRAGLPTGPTAGNTPAAEGQRVTMPATAFPGTGDPGTGSTACPPASAGDRGGRPMRGPLEQGAAMSSGRRRNEHLVELNERDLRSARTRPPRWCARSPTWSCPRPA
jgi:ketosteroid isomerase-like protein